MSPSNELIARAERARLHWMSDADLEAAVEIARESLQRCNEDELVGYIQVSLASIPGGLHGEPVEPAARAIIYLARHGIPHGFPSAD